VPGEERRRDRKEAAYGLDKAIYCCYCRILMGLVRKARRQPFLGNMGVIGMGKSCSVSIVLVLVAIASASVTAAPVLFPPLEATSPVCQCTCASPDGLGAGADGLSILEGTDAAATASLVVDLNAADTTVSVRIAALAVRTFAFTAPSDAALAGFPASLARTGGRSWPLPSVGMPEIDADGHLPEIGQSHELTASCLDLDLPPEGLAGWSTTRVARNVSLGTYACSLGMANIRW
jgi:hypothetical protein